MSDPQVHYPRLLSPITLGPVQMTHRAFMSAHGMGLGTGGPGVSERYQAYLLARARGGAALVGIESAPVHASTFSRSLVIRLDQDGCVPSLAHLAREVHAAGARIAITLWHGGHKDGALRGAYPVAPSAIPGMDGTTPHVLTTDEIADIVAAYGSAAMRCRQAGIDVLEVQTATDYLLGSFLSPALNHRNDAYGGDRLRRLRIVREVLTAVRRAADGLAVGARCSARHDIPGADIDYTLEESVAAMSQLARDGLVDYVSVMSGSGWAEGVSIPAQHHPRMTLATEGRAFKAALPLPVIIAGRIRSAQEAETLLATGAADAVAMARTWIAEPDWSRKVADGRENEIRPCMSCNQGCVGQVFRGVPGSCLLNPRAGRELDWPEVAPQSVGGKRTLAIIGGGPAGLELARLAALAGFRVELHEASTVLGGQWRLAGQAPGRAELLLALAWWRSELLRLGVTVHLGRRIEAGESLAADYVVHATGGHPSQTAVWRLRPFLRDGIPGAGLLAHGREYLEGGRPASGRVAVIDEEHGWPTLSLVMQLLQDSRVEHVHVLTTESLWGSSAVGPTFESAVLEQLRAESRSRLTIQVTKVSQVIDNKNIIVADGTMTFDTVLLATGTAAQPVPAGALAVGDCVAPRGIAAATADAQRLIQRLSI